ncbi:hypothetical protein F66182_3963 [Fusarium sp. NRRL 66182]|nr:hypothetical protein F66182_3963 [Fusarium sp. NRRL 66182]
MAKKEVALSNPCCTITCVCSNDCLARKIESDQSWAPTSRSSSRFRSFIVLYNQTIASTSSTANHSSYRSKQSQAKQIKSPDNHTTFALSVFRFGSIALVDYVLLRLLTQPSFSSELASEPTLVSLSPRFFLRLVDAYKLVLGTTVSGPIIMMERSGYLVARSLDELNHAFQLVPRDNNCVKCDDDAELECPKCADDEVCQFTVPLDCTMCATSVCEKSDSDTSDNDSGGPNIGAIVGGVLGGIVVIAIATYIVWRFCIKPKRSQIPTSIYIEDVDALQSEKEAASRGTRPPSTHTVHSIASTVLTRASNIIQIAYIPGVTNRATPTSPNVLVPPVPPIPMHHAEANRGQGGDDQHFFVPGDLRDSTYSGLSGYSDRTSYARTSYAPRSSVASTIYGKQAQVLTPAQTGMRAKPTVVSVRSVGNNGGEPNAPPVPTIDFGRFGGGGRPKSGASAFSVGSTFLNSANTATQARAQVVKVGTLKKVDMGSKTESDTSSSTAGSSPPATPSGNVTRDSSITVIDESPSMDQGPFSDPPERPSTQKTNKAPSLGAVMEDAVGEDDKPPAPQRRDSSPFGDQHATKE